MSTKSFRSKLILESTTFLSHRFSRRIRKFPDIFAAGFSNSILWPLFHYHPGEMNFDAANWLAYREANMRFADVVASMANAGDMVWVQDYHLMLLPMLLRSIISGESAQGEMVRRELGRVKEGVDETVVKDVLGMNQGVAEPFDEGVEMLDEVREEEVMDAVKHGKKPAFVRGMSAYQKQELVAMEKGKEGIRIGFFLHTPFPSSEIYRCVLRMCSTSPTSADFLKGFCQCGGRFYWVYYSATSSGEENALGLGPKNHAKVRSSFHTYDYARHFLSSCTRILGLMTMPNGIEFEGRYAQVGTFPIGIEPMQFIDGLRREKVQNRLQTLEQRFRGCKIIIGVDRLDYIKGIPQKLHALEVFLAQHPEWVGKVREPGWHVSSADSPFCLCPTLCVSINVAYLHIPVFPVFPDETGRPGATRHSVPTRRGRVPKPSRMCQRARWADQRSIWHCRVHADSLYAQVGTF